MLKKIVVIGPESTGKTVLCEKLAAHFNTRWVPEYARGFLLTNGPAYTFEQLTEIACGQVAAEENTCLELLKEPFSPISGKPRPVFIDTDLYVMKVWSEFVFNKCDNLILRGIASRNFDLYLLCDTDLPWVKDALREYPDLENRRKLYHYYKDAMVNQSAPWVEINGNEEERFGKALEAVNALL